MEKEPKREYLPRIIEKTRKARIQTEKRLLCLDALLRHVTVFYSSISIVLSLMPLFLHDASGRVLDAISFLSIASAVIFTICSLYASGQNYAVRAERIKFAYLELQRIALELDDAIESAGREDTTQRIDSIAEHYVDIVSRTENHTDMDFRIGTGRADGFELLRYSIQLMGLRLGIYLALPIALVLITFVVCF
ncbi:SLATT domain-containing protein [Collinsella intestinalis]|uniref:SLATT domain-containing protein n=1 Tax=Collinsella intestinalis TaxID=147207 RepID=UPI00195AC8C4|nr:SLATT domain-containing protein [Collinsella intestinalis]MBM6907158.1 SLATT domain-containing protein [Collinsella intestinalis]MBM6941884.1 SLATT domain-containing protein [Collinsella intestinalis]